MPAEKGNGLKKAPVSISKVSFYKFLAPAFGHPVERSFSGLKMFEFKIFFIKNI